MITVDSVSSGKAVGDPTLVGWAVCVLYAIAGFMAATRSRRDPAEPVRDRRFWWYGGIVLLLLSVNKQLDLQTLLIDGARSFTKGHHLWEHRRTLQLTTFSLLTVGCAIAGVVWFASLKALKLRYPLAFWGYVLIGTYLLIRVFCINHIERFLGLHWKDAPFLQVIELAGIVCVILGAVSFRTVRSSKV